VSLLASKITKQGVYKSRGYSPRRRTDSDHKFNIAPNLLDRDFAVAGPNQKCPLMVCRQTIAGWQAGDIS
jgi:transposase InsO family protein